MPTTISSTSFDREFMNIGFSLPRGRQQLQMKRDHRSSLSRPVRLVRLFASHTYHFKQSHLEKRSTTRLASLFDAGSLAFTQEDIFLPSSQSGAAMRGCPSLRFVLHIIRLKRMQLLCRWGSGIISSVVLTCYNLIIVCR